MASQKFVVTFLIDGARRYLTANGDTTRMAAARQYTERTANDVAWQFREDNHGVVESVDLMAVPVAPKRNTASDADDWRDRLIEDVNAWAFGTPEDMGVHRIGRYEPDVGRWEPIAADAAVSMRDLRAAAKPITAATPYLAAEQRLGLRSQLAARMTDHLRVASPAAVERYAYHREDYMAAEEEKAPRARRPAARTAKRNARQYRDRQYEVLEWNVRTQQWAPLGRATGTTPKYALEEFMASHPGYSPSHLRAEEIKAGAAPIDPLMAADIEESRARIIKEIAPWANGNDSRPVSVGRWATSPARQQRHPRSG